jgi:hypothetical protein
MTKRQARVEPHGELQRGLVATALGVLLGLVAVVFSRKQEKEKTWRGRRAT